MTRFLWHNTVEILLRVGIMFFEHHDSLTRGRFSVIVPTTYLPWIQLGWYVDSKITYLSE